MKNAADTFSTKLHRWIPGLRLLREYQLAWLPKDLAAGMTLGTIMIPAGLAFGELAGVPLAGLYAGMLPLVFYALFGSSKQLIIGPDASMAALVALNLAPLANGDAVRLTVLAGLLALLIGVICIAASLMRLGFVADFLAKPVIVGFMHGMAVVIAVGLLPKVLGVSGSGETTAALFLSVCGNLSSIHWVSFAIGASSVAIILACRRWWPKIPGQIVALVLGILAVRVFNLEALGVKVVGIIPQGLPSVHAPLFTLADFNALLPLALAAAVVAISDSVATARGFASRNRYRVDANQEMLALGLGNIASSLTQGLPVSGSGSRTAAAESAGSRTQLTSLVAASIVACVMLFLTSLFYSLPSAALGGILIAAAWSLCDFPEFKRMWRFSGAGLVGALLTMAGVVGGGVIEGIGIGVLYSLVLLMKALAFPDDAVLGETATGEFRDVTRAPDARSVSGVLVYRFSAPLFFANCGQFRNRIESLLETASEPVRAVVIDASPIIRVDLAGCELLSEMHAQLRSRGVRLIIADLRSAVHEAVVKGWEGAATEESLFFANVAAAVQGVQSNPVAAKK